MRQGGIDMRWRVTENEPEGVFTKHVMHDSSPKDATFNI